MGSYDKTLIWVVLTFKHINIELNGYPAVKQYIIIISLAKESMLNSFKLYTSTFVPNTYLTND